MISPLTGYQPADLIAALDHEIPQTALFTTFTFSPGAFHQQYLAPLLQHGCGDITVLADTVGYAQSLFESAAVQGIGTDYRLRQISLRGAFHAKLVLVRTRTTMILGIGSGNLTSSGLQTNAEVAALYTVRDPQALQQLDALCGRLRTMARLQQAVESPIGPIGLTSDARLLSSLDNTIFDQLDLPADVQRIEIVSPFVDGQLEVLALLRELWPSASIRIRLDPGFGALSDSLLANRDERVEILVPVDGELSDEQRRPAVHGKLICFIGAESSTVILGSANLSRPALLSTDNFEAVIERRMPTDVADRLMAVPRVQWRSAQDNDRRRVSMWSSGGGVGLLLATLSLRQLALTWSGAAHTNGSVSLWRRCDCVFQQEIGLFTTSGALCSAELEITDEAKRAITGPCVAEVRFLDGTCYRGWVEIADLLDITPIAKRQLGVLEDIAADPVSCKADDVVKFIQWLHRSLASSRSSSYLPTGPPTAKLTVYDETPIQRSLLLETNGDPAHDPGTLLNRLMNRSLDAAIHDLRFFNRDQVSNRLHNRESNSGSSGGNAGAQIVHHDPAPPAIEAVLRALFVQLAEEFDRSISVGMVARSLTQIPTCIKALTLAVEKWPAHFRDNDFLVSSYFHRVAIACLAPGLASSVGHCGAITRLTPVEMKLLYGGIELSRGIALLESYLLLSLPCGNMARTDVLKDMHDVLARLPPSSDENLSVAMTELWHLQAGAAAVPPDVSQCRSEIAHLTGELAGIRRCRDALRELINLANQGLRAGERVDEVLCRASGHDPAKAQVLVDLLLSSSGRPRLFEVVSNDEACPFCYTTLPVAARSRLTDTSFVHRCNCGSLLVRSLDA